MMMMNEKYVTVLHRDPYNREKMNAVALVSVPNVNLLNTNEILENAYVATQNIEGSWSMDGYANIKLLAGLHEENGKTYGLRSSMMGDQMIVDGVVYEVDMIGFKEV